MLRIAFRESADLDRQRKRHKELVEFMEQTLGDIDHSSVRVLDVGCGPGWLVERLRERGYMDLHGCDFVETTSDECEYTRIDLDADGLDRYEDESFDIVVSSEVMEHLERPAAILRDMARVVKPGGHLFVTVPNCANVFERLGFFLSGNSIRYRYQEPEEHGHISMFTSNVFEGIAKRANLDILSRVGGYVYWQGHYFRMPTSPLFSYELTYHMCKSSREDSA